MIAKWILLLLAANSICPVLLAQTGFDGPAMPAIKAGDFAPTLTYERELSPPDAVKWISADFNGKITVLVFYPNTSSNEESVTRWNALIDQFAGKPIQFLWITAERQASLLPWLSQHPVKGYVLLDRSGASAKAYGIDTPAAVFVGPDTRILGFDREILPSDDHVQAALDGRITTTRPPTGEFEPTDERRTVVLDAEPRRFPTQNQYKPNFPPSYIFHVSPSQSRASGSFSGMDYWSLQGVQLTDAIRNLYGLNAIRIEVAPAFNDGVRYDLSLVLPQPETRDQITNRAKQGIQDYFHMTAVHEARLMDVYVVTAIEKRPPELPTRGVKGGFANGSWIGLGSIQRSPSVPPAPFGLADLNDVDTEGTADEFCYLLESILDRPVVNETNLQGEFAFRVKESSPGKGDFLEQLRDQLGIVISPAERTVDMLVFKPQ